MTELHVCLESQEGRGPELESAYWRVFVPAISRREGFRRVALLKKRDAPGEYELDIAFASEALRIRWVDSPEHAVAWPELAKRCRRVTCAGYDVCEPGAGRARRGATR
jgi:heme-degrading monooxygenase HmoA